MTSLDYSIKGAVLAGKDFVEGMVVTPLRVMNFFAKLDTMPGQEAQELGKATTELR